TETPDGVDMLKAVDNGVLSAAYQAPSMSEVADERAEEAAEQEDLTELRSRRANAIADAIDAGDTDEIHAEAAEFVDTANEKADVADSAVNQWLEDVAVSEAMNDPDMTPEVAEAELEVATVAYDEAVDSAESLHEQADADAAAMTEITTELQEKATEQQAAIEDALAAGYTMEEIQAYMSAQDQAGERQTSSRRTTQADDDDPLLKIFDAQKAVQDLLASATAVVADAQASSAAASRADAVTALLSQSKAEAEAVVEAVDDPVM
ncbi:uncharacterized protein METZ01_LOCUS433864, partial [marine metagenome]